jgi:chromosome segregation ATPase
MTENESAKFRIRSDDNPEAHFQEDNQGLKLDKLSRRLTLITILIPCLIGGILFLVYRDIQMRVGQVSDTGTSKVRTLSKDMESRYSSLSLKHGKFQVGFTKRISSLEKTTVSLQKTLQEATTAIKYIRSARRSDNKKVAKAIDAINKTLGTLAPLPQNLETMASEIKLYDQNLSKELGSFSQSLEGIRNNLIKIQADILFLASAKTDNKAFNLALKSQQKNHQQALQQTKRDIDKKIASLESKIKRIGQVETPPGKKSQTKSSQKSGSVPPESQPDSKAKTSQNTATPKSSEDKSSLPKPGSFIEQDIK